MVEISEKERARRSKLREEGKLKSEAASFRLGPTHINRLKELSQWRDISQTDLMRQMIDKEYKRIKERREELRAARAAG